MKVKLFFSGLILGLAVVSCTKNMTLNKSNATLDLPEGSTPVLHATDQFAIDFFRESLKQDPANNNKLISPLSIYIALSMVYNGADNETKGAIANALRLKNIDISTLNKVVHAIQSHFPTLDGKVTLDIANSIWYRKNSFQPLPNFLSILQKDYASTAQPLDFENPQSVKTINDWVSQKTNKKIPTIIDRISPDDLMYLINAVYFNGKWKNQFKKQNTRDGIFHLADGSQKAVPFMHQDGKLNWTKNNSLTMVELPYGDGKHFSMFAVQPNSEAQPLTQFALSLSAESLKEAMKNMDSSRVQLVMPKWEYAYEIKDMKPELSAMGMGIAFTRQADFSKMYRSSDARVEITQAIHKSYIKVDEEGTEAAAVTGIGVGVTSMPLMPAIRLDRPFLYFILEKQTGTILFIGLINDPASSN